MDKHPHPHLGEPVDYLTDNSRLFYMTLISRANTSRQQVELALFRRGKNYPAILMRGWTSSRIKSHITLIQTTFYRDNNINLFICLPTKKTYSYA
jgi:hypothetical protein